MNAFVSKGPAHDSTRGPWEMERHQGFQKYLKAGDEGFRVMMELARSKNGRARNAATIFFTQSSDPRAVNELRRLLSDKAATVRSRALRFYADCISPESGPRGGWSEKKANSIPDGIEAILPMIDDPNQKVQMDAIQKLSVYTHLGNRSVNSVLEQLLKNPKHKIQHAAARALGLKKCPGCGDNPKG